MLTKAPAPHVATNPIPRSFASPSDQGAWCNCRAKPGLVKEAPLALIVGDREHPHLCRQGRIALRIGGLPVGAAGAGDDRPHVHCGLGGKRAGLKERAGQGLWVPRLHLLLPPGDLLVGVPLGQHLVPDRRKPLPQGGKNFVLVCVGLAMPHMVEAMLDH